MSIYSSFVKSISKGHLLLLDVFLLSLLSCKSTIHPYPPILKTIDLLEKLNHLSDWQMDLDDCFFF